MADCIIQPFTDAHRAWAEEFITQTWGSAQQVSRGKLHNVLEYPGFVALTDDTPQGITTFHIDDDTCEVLMLQGADEDEDEGIRSALIDHLAEHAHEAGCKRLWLITTNDNIPAIRWYQKRGFKIAAIHADALAESRKLKPDLPQTGIDDIPLRDEIEFEMTLPPD